MFLEFLKFKIGINSLYYEKCSNNRGNVGLTLKRFGIKLGFVVGELLYLSDLKKQYIWNLDRIIFWDQKNFYWKLLPQFQAGEGIILLNFYWWVKKISNELNSTYLFCKIHYLKNKWGLAVLVSYSITGNIEEKNCK